MSKTKQNVINQTRKLLLRSVASSIFLLPYVAHAQITANETPLSTSNPETQADTTQGQDEIVVTARLRSESLMDVPVAVNAISADTLDQYAIGDLTDIGSLVPNVIISDYKINGGGSLSIRGISSPATQVGFEQPVSVSMDGVQTSAGRVAMLGFFDMKNVEVMRGPQALFFGKNSPAGVISVASKGPTDTFEAGGKVGYEFEGREISTEGYISGPLTESIGARLAVKHRDLGGWLNNNAMPIENPFFAPGLPPETEFLPGRATETIGETETLARLTLDYDAGGALTAVAKLFLAHGTGEGAGAFAQNIGACAEDGLPRSYGFADPFGDCNADDQTSYGAIPDVVAQALPRGGDSGEPRDEMDAVIGSLNLSYDFGNMTATSISGYVKHDYYYLSALDQTVYGGLIVLEDNTLEAISQEVRLASDFDSPVNFLLGAYFQDSTDDLYNNTLVTPYVFFGLAGNGRYDAYEKVADLKSTTYSAFGQLLWDIADDLELAGGLRYTHEKRTTTNENLYGFGPFNTGTTVFPGSTDQTPGILAGEFNDDNLSPEVTLTYRPTQSLTAWAGYKTGFKSGGFALTSPMQTTATLGDIDFDSETVSGGEFGLRGDYGPLDFSATAFLYDFKDLQATVYNPVDVRYVISNAGKLEQRGIEFDASYDFSNGLEVHGALAYVENRYRDYVGQCYFFAYAGGADPATSDPADGCRFVDPGASLLLEQDYEGKAPARSPDLTGSFGGSYEQDISPKLYFRIAGDAYYSDDYNASDALSPAALQSDFWRFNASVMLGKIDDSWQLSLIGKNLTNEHYVLFAADRTGGSTRPGIGEQRGAIARGREIALQLGFNF